MMRNSLVAERPPPIQVREPLEFATITRSPGRPEGASSNTAYTIDH